MIFTLFFMLLLAPVTQADILFLDLNNNPKEIETARIAASKRGEKLIVLPQISPEKRKLLQEAEQRLLNISNLTKKCLTNRPNCRDLLHEMSIASNNLKQLKEANGLMDNNLKKAVLALKDKNASINALVISGHDGNGHFSGSYGSLMDTQIKEAFDEAAPLGDSIRSLYLWGCYTTNAGSLEQNWKELLPNLQVIAGFEGSAPLGNRKSNWDLLHDTLIKEDKFTKARDAQHLTRLFKELRGAGALGASICFNKETIINKNGVFNKEAQLRKCKENISKDLEEKYTCYLRAEQGCENVPNNTSSSPLRDFYNYIQSTKHCENILAENGFSRPSPDNIIRLIFEKQVRHNFERLHHTDLAVMNGRLGKMGLAKLKFENISEMSRKEFLDKLFALQEEARRKSQQNKGGVPEAIELENYHATLSMVTSHYCVPFEWIEPNATSDSNCPIKQGILTAQASAIITAWTKDAYSEAAQARIHHPLMNEIKSVREKIDAIYNRNTEGANLYTEYFQAKKLEEQLEHQLEIETEKVKLATLQKKIEEIPSQQLSTESQGILKKKLSETITFTQIKVDSLVKNKNNPRETPSVYEYAEDPNLPPTRPDLEE